MQRILLICTVISLLFILNGCYKSESSLKTNNMTKEENLIEQNSNSIDDFNFVIGFDVDAKNVLDTFKGTFTKDLIPGSATAKLKLTNNEMKLIYEEMKRINLLNYADNFRPEGNLFTTPHYTYYVRVQMDGKIKEIHWEDSNLSQSAEALNLRSLINKIRIIVYDKSEYKKMPATIGGYD